MGSSMQLLGGTNPSQELQWWRGFQECSLFEVAFVDPSWIHPNLGCGWGECSPGISREKNLCLLQASSAQIQVLNAVSCTGAQPGFQR